MPREITLRSRDASAAWNFDAGAAEVIVSFADGVGTAVTAEGQTLLRTSDPFEALAWLGAYDLSATPEARWIGYLSYDLARHIERLPATARDDLALPLFCFTLHRPRQASPAIAQPASRVSRLRSRTFDRPTYLKTIRRALDYIAAGDVFQVNLAQRFSFETSQTAQQLWEALAAPLYGALLDYGGHAIVSNSHELFFRVEPLADGRRRIVNRPIKGTRPRAAGMAAELEASAKDRAELAMIVDLQRNDLGRVCEIGSVRVLEPRAIEAHPTVYHGVATIDGMLRADAGFADVLRALFPCGSVTGCPKIRAMEIIDELEPVARGPYCGAIGYLAADGAMEFNVAIRTTVVQGSVAHVWVGGGIVADSTPAAEYEETIVKAQATFDALGVLAGNVASLREDRAS